MDLHKGSPDTSCDPRSRPTFSLKTPGITSAVTRASCLDPGGQLGQVVHRDDGQVSVEIGRFPRRASRESEHPRLRARQPQVSAPWILALFHRMFTQSIVSSLTYHSASTMK